MGMRAKGDRKREGEGFRDKHWLAIKLNVIGAHIIRPHSVSVVYC